MSRYGSSWRSYFVQEALDLIDGIDEVSGKAFDESDFGDVLRCAFLHDRR